MQFLSLKLFTSTSISTFVYSYQYNEEFCLSRAIQMLALLLLLLMHE